MQGVGFRPFVHRLATELGLDGSVGNDTTRVVVEVAGPSERIDDLTRRLVTDAPPLARVDRVTMAALAPGDIGLGFHIVESEERAGAPTIVPPDSGVCDDCLAELHDPTDRRFGHPFITCTNCGPRFTIIRDLPYDRSATTLAGFVMCDRCRAEYEDPMDRRYHAQPIGCHDCGPRLRLGRIAPPRGAIEGAAELLDDGRVVAIKGLGGFHLACDATSDDAVAELRARKRRPSKPFAVMVADLDAASRLAELSPAEADQLTSPARPVVLLRSRHAVVSGLVAPDNPLIGVMLPSTPIHHLLLDGTDRVLVMTSANVSGEPLVSEDDDPRLDALCDAALTHDRSIAVPCDDSVVRIAGDVLLPIRRARGFAPLPVPMATHGRTVLAVGGELKNTCCLAGDDRAWSSQHLGDMEDLLTQQAFERTVARMQDLTGLRPDVVAVDAHPGYATSRWARRTHPGEVIEVQHHHAHIAAVMAEHELDPSRPVIGFAFDGTGYGDDGTIWGGEVLVASASSARRVRHLHPVPLPGGDAAVRHPHRIALSHLAAADLPWTADLAPVAAAGADVELLRRQLDRGVACVPTTSMGRLFDAVASLLGLRQAIDFEAQAAIDLEIAAARWSGPVPTYSFDLEAGSFDQRPVVRAIVDDLRSGVPVEAIASGFHDAVATAVVVIATDLRAEGAGDVAALSGGVFQNAMLVERCTAALIAAGLTALTHHLV
ncbi:MAG: carbamoyltransferase HypF, partial [Actinomycetota bacterium]